MTANYKNYKASDFALGDLIKLKKEKRVTIGLCVPSLNEAKNIKKVVEVVKKTGKLIDEFVIIDSGSKDKTEEICKKKNYPFIKDTQASKEIGYKLVRGKGYNLWASLYYLQTDIIVWVDADIKTINTNYIAGLVAPLLTDKKIKFVKGYYNKTNGGGRVTEMLVRPYFNLLFPKLSYFIQPLSGEVASYRNFLEKLTFFSGYSIEVALLIQVIEELQDEEIAQICLGEKDHESRDLINISLCSANILSTLFILSDELGILKLNKKLSDKYLYFKIEKENVNQLKFNLGEEKLPLMKGLRGGEEPHPYSDREMYAITSSRGPAR